MTMIKWIPIDQFFAEQDKAAIRKLPTCSPARSALIESVICLEHKVWADKPHTENITVVESSPADLPNVYLR